MSKSTHIARIQTGVRNLDALLGGGIPKGAMVVVAGPPGSGKTILTQQICFHNATPKTRVLYFSTLSEPTAKVLRYLSQFAFFDADKLEKSIRFVDLGALIRQDGLEPASALILKHVKSFKPSIVVVDSFKVFDDLAASQEALRKFGYELAVNLMAWESTALLLGEYGLQELETNPLFSIVDALVTATQREVSGERQRFLHVVKMRGTEHSLEEHPFTISPTGIEIYAHRTAARRDPAASAARHPTGVSKLDDLVGGGFPGGSAVLVSGAAGTGKTLLLLELIYRGALAGERGLFVSFEENKERLLTAARGFGWNLEREIARGMVEIVFVPQPEIRVEAHLLMIEERVAALKARRVSIDSVSVFLHKIGDPQVARDKIYHLVSILHGAGAVGFLAADIPFGENRVSRLGVEETVVDGVILLSSSEEGLERQRYMEIYKLRGSTHLRGRHAMIIGEHGLEVFPRYSLEVRPDAPAFELARRVPSGVAGFDALLGGGLLARSMTLVAGSTGLGKTTLGLQFLLEGARLGEPGILFTLEEDRSQLLASADALGLPLRRAAEEGLVAIVPLAREHVRAPQFLSLLADRITQQKAARLILDGARHVVSAVASAEELQDILHGLVVRFRLLGATSLVLIQTETLYSTDFSSDGLSAIADNLVTMRYARTTRRLQPLITVVKTRGSAHDWRTHGFTIERGGLRIDARSRVDPPKRAGATRAPTRKR